jgi:CPA2 family monovalent cation:H+ antiporter-2
MMQGGEFAFILAQIGLDNGWIDRDFYSQVITTSILSFFLTPFLIDRSDDWYYSLREFVRRKSFKLYKLFFVKFGGLEPIDQPDMTNHVVICGFGRVGNYIGRAFEKVGVRYIVIDSNSETVDYCKQRGIRFVYGDASNIDILEKADVERAFAVVIALPKEGDTEIVASNVQKLNPAAKIIARSHEPVEHLLNQSLKLLFLFLKRY